MKYILPSLVQCGAILFLMIFSFSMKAQVAKNAQQVCPLLIGEQLDGSLRIQDAQGNDLTVDKIVNNQPTVLIVYRGGWCPYCNKHLYELQEVESEVLQLGFQIIAVSPDALVGAKKMEEKIKTKYKIYSDANNVLSQALGVAYRTPSSYKGLLLKHSDGQNEFILPVPSVFILDKSAKVRFSYVNPNYKRRLKGDLLLAILKGMKE